MLDCMKAIDLSGKRFGKLTVTSQFRTTTSGRQWLCKCDCGGEKWARGADLTRQRHTNCGCRIYEPEIGQVFGSWTVIESVPGFRKTTVKVRCICQNTSNVPVSDLRHGKSTQCKDCASKSNRKGDGESARNRTIRGYINGAKKRKIPFELSVEDMLTIFSLNCYYCGKEPCTVTRENSGDFVYNGIDRVDNSIGYIANNCVPCCAICNRMKRDLTVDEFIAHVQRISQMNYERTGQRVEFAGLPSIKITGVPGLTRGKVD